MVCDTPIWVLPKAAFEKVPVPCGRCPPCKIRRVNSWVFRLEQEMLRSSSAHFVTLTYDTHSVPISDNGFMTLRKKDFQDYMKRLRKLTANTIKYYAVGEYGTNNRRPHYHAIIFNVPDSSLHAQAWSVHANQFGSVHIGTVTSDSMAYCMKYIDKLGTARQHARDDREKEFSLMSKGLGDNYVNNPQVQSYYKADLSRLHLTKLDGYRIALPRHYRLKLFNEDERRQQRHIITDVLSQKQIHDARQYQIDNPDATIDFQQYSERAKLVRNRSYNHNLKPRNL